VKAVERPAALFAGPGCSRVIGAACGWTPRAVRRSRCPSVSPFQTTVWRCRSAIGRCRGRGWSLPAPGPPAPPPAPGASAGSGPGRMSNRIPAASANPTTAETASAATDAAGASSTADGSSARSTSRDVNTPATRAARPDQHRSHPRTVKTGRSRRSTIRRCTQPAAANSSPAPTPSTRSARLTSNVEGRRMCVAERGSAPGPARTDRHRRRRPARPPGPSPALPARAPPHSVARRRHRRPPGGRAERGPVAAVAGVTPDRTPLSFPARDPVTTGYKRAGVRLDAPRRGGRHYARKRASHRH
jgi:hypothetical protein